MRCRVMGTFFPLVLLAISFCLSLALTASEQEAEFTKVGVLLPLSGGKLLGALEC